MKVLVTGGGGFLGRYLVEQLQARGHEVSVLARGDYPFLRRAGVRLVRADLADAVAVRQACQGVERVFHAASQTGPWGDWRDFHRTNVMGTDHVVRGCLAEGVHKLVYTSTPSVLSCFGNLSGVNESHPFPRRRLSGYQHTKMLAEQRVLAANGQGGLVTTALRPHALWGPRDTQVFQVLMARHREGRLVQVGDGRNRISVSYVENAAHAHLQAADSDRVGGKVYFVNEPEPVEMWAWINRCFESVGLPPVTRRVPYALAYALGAGAEFRATVWPRGGPPRLTRSLAALFAKEHFFDIAAAQRDFGLASPVSMEEGYRRFAAHFAGQGAQALRGARHE